MDFLYLLDKYIDIKTVPPVEALLLSAKPAPNPLTIPPKIHNNKISSITIIGFKIGASIETNTVCVKDKIVNNF